MKEREPYVNGLGAILVPDAGIVNYPEIAEKLAEIIQSRGGDIYYQQYVNAIYEHDDYVEVQTPQTRYQAKQLINCAGLHSDRIAKLAGYETGMRIVPFLGVHFTRMYNGKRDVGPNAVLAFKREGYRKIDFSFRDLAETPTYKGFWKIAIRYFDVGMAEMRRSFSHKLFTDNARLLIPDLQPEDITSGEAGVRAQALTVNWSMIFTFWLVVVYCIFAMHFHQLQQHPWKLGGKLSGSIFQRFENIAMKSC